MTPHLRVLGFGGRGPGPALAYLQRPDAAGHHALHGAVGALQEQRAVGADPPAIPRPAVCVSTSTSRRTSRAASSSWSSAASDAVGRRHRA